MTIPAESLDESLMNLFGELGVVLCNGRQKGGVRKEVIASVWP